MNQLDSRPKLQPGTLLRDTYTVVSFIGRGAFADTYLVRHRYMGMQALKLLISPGDDESLQVGLAEAFLLSRITHNGIVRVFDANEVLLDGKRYPYLTMEYVPDGTLAEMLEACGDGLQLSIALDIAAQITAALGHAHSQDPPIIHRDIKPANVLLEIGQDERVRVQVADFGLACRVNRLTEVAEATGTVMYMSPESMRGYEVAASDVFSAGLVFYQLLTGTLPYPASNLRDAGSVHGLQSAVLEAQKQPMKPPSYFDRKIPPGVDAVALRALEPDERKRYATGDAFAEAIHACQVATGMPHAAAGDLQAATAKSAVHAAMALAGSSETLGQAVVKLTAAIERWPHLEQYYGQHLESLLSQQKRLQCS